MRHILGNAAMTLAVALFTTAVWWPAHWLQLVLTAAFALVVGAALHNDDANQ